MHAHWIGIVMIIISIERLRARTIPWFFGHFWKCSEVVEFWHVDWKINGRKFKGSFLLWAFQLTLSLQKSHLVIDSLLCNFDDVILGNLVMNQLIICKLLFLVILITCLLDFVLYCKEKFCCGHSRELKD